MSEKTLGQIAMEAMQAAYRKMWEERRPCLENEDWIAAANAVIEECAKVADKWGRGEWRVQEQKRVRFSLQDLQTHINIAGRGIAEDIRALKSPEPTS